MIQGRNAQEVIAEVLRQADAKKDFIVPAQTLTMTQDSDGVFQVGFDGEGEYRAFTPTGVFHDQLGTHLGVPAKFYDRIQREFPGLLTETVNTLLHSKDENRMLRTLDGQARAFLSDRYRRLDNDEIARFMVPMIQGSGLDVKSLEITDTRFYMQVVSPRTEGEVRKGDVVQAGFILSNSEVGYGALALKPLIYRLVCTNGMVLPDHAQRHRHLGTRQAEGTLDFSKLSDEAQAASDKALWLGVRDTVTHLTSQDGFNGLLEALRESADDPITGHPEKVVRQLSKVHGFRDDEENQILRNLLDAGDLSRWGLANAVTATANDLKDYDRAVDLERRGGELMFAGGREWTAIADAVK